MTKLNLDQLALLRLISSVDGIGYLKLRLLIDKFGTLDNIAAAKFRSLSEIGGISENTAMALYKTFPALPQFKETLEKEITKLQQMGASIVTIWDEDYPALLSKIFDPPLLLYYKGSFTENDSLPIAVVGTRMPTHYGKMQADKIASALAEQNVTVVSGMARGIDSTAHTAALRTGGRTLAVIGSGIDVCYPPENRKLLDQITENGAVITEFKPGAPPDGTNFPKRNRIISGFSLAVVVVESAVTGGAMHTASLALDQNREVFAVPGNLGVRQSEGTNLLIKRSEAKLITSAEDILLDLELKLKPVVGKNIPRPKKDINLFEEKILELLKEEPVYIDIIAEKSALSVSECLVHLLTLEFKGLVKQLPGKLFSAV